MRSGISAKRILACAAIGALAQFTNLAMATDMRKDCSIKLAGIHFTQCLNGADARATVAGDTVTIKAGARQDYFNDPDGKLSNNTAPVLLAKVDNTKPFTLVAQVTPRFDAMYDAGALYLFVSEKLWQKFAFERDERGATRIVSVRTNGTSDDNNHEAIREQAAWLKMSSDTRTIGLYFSTDRKTWHLARLYKNGYPATVHVGLSTQSPVGDGTSATFAAPELTRTSVKDFRLGM